MRIDRPRYPAPLRRFHWLVFALVALAYLFIELQDEAARGSTLREALRQAHFWAGIAVLVLLLPRVRARMRATVPPITPAPARWSERIAGLTHVLLYAFLLVQPLLGFATLELGGHALAPLPPLVTAPNRSLAHSLEDVHALIGNTFYFVIGLHIAASLWHHFVRRDDTLKRML